MRPLIYRAMHQSDDLVVEFDYCDAQGAGTNASLARFGSRAPAVFSPCASAAKKPVSSTWNAARTWGRHRP